jgi:death-on-curing protein
MDDNKRTAAVVSETLLVLNESRLTATDAELVVAFVALSGGELSEEEKADRSVSTSGRFEYSRSNASMP